MNTKNRTTIEKHKSYIGKKFNSLTILDVEVSDKRVRYRFVCKCDCGNTTIVRTGRVINGYTKTCGCRNKGYNYHDADQLSIKYRNIYSIWNTMRHRCYDPKNHKFKNYGARGIVVCDEWKYKFEPFLTWALQNGYKKGLTIDRINNDGNYEPSNCRWANPTTQARNKTTNKLVTYKGETKCVAQWCDDLNISYDTVRARIRLGWSADKAFETPISRSNKYNKL